MKSPTAGAIALCLLVAALPASLTLTSASSAGATTADGAGSWNTTLQFNASGGPGEWAILYHEIPQPTPERYTVIFNFNFTTSATAGEPFSYALTAPRFIFERGVKGYGPYDLGPLAVDGLPPGEFIQYLRIYHEPEGDRRTYTVKDFPTVVGIQGITGVAFFAASSAPWQVDLTLQLLEGRHFSARPLAGPYVEPSFVSRGANATFYTVAETPLLDAYLGTTTAAFGYNTPGWTHAQYNWHSDDPLYRGVHQHRFEFPNGFLYAGPKVSPRADLTGYGLPVNVEPIPVRSVGTMTDTPGTFQASVTRLDAARDVSLYAFHVPMVESDGFPPQFQRMSYGCEILDWDFNEKPPKGGAACNEERTAGTPQPI